MNVKNTLVGLLAVIALIFGVMYFKSQAVIQVPPLDIKLDATSLGSIKAPAPVVNVEAAKPVVVPAPVVNVNVPKQTLGAVSGPISPYSYMGYGGVVYWASPLTSLQTGSSTVCALQAPSVSTSTLVSGSITFTLASTSAVSLDLARGTTKYATSTVIGNSYTVGASAQASIVASSTDSAATTFGPSEWFIVRFNTLSSSSGAGNAPTGRCSAVWRQI